MKKHEIGPCRGAPYLRCMTHGLAGCHECSPPAKNSEAPGASGADDGQGACTHTHTKPLGSKNRDKTGELTVRKGVIADWGGLRFRVQRVRQGRAYGETIYMHRSVTAECCFLRVVPS